MTYKTIYIVQNRRNLERLHIDIFSVCEQESAGAYSLHTFTFYNDDNINTEVILSVSNLQSSLC